MPFRLSSNAFFNGAPIPVQYTCDGENISPAINWDEPPSATRGFALVMRDPGAPKGVFYHWALWNMPIEAAGLPEGMPKTVSLQLGSGSMVQGTNDSQNPGYGGPCPPRGHGKHNYEFVLTALDVPSLPLGAGADCREVEAAAAQHAIAVAKLIGTYERS